MSTKHSRLLQLPPEIRLLIWTSVCGDKLLHIYRGDDDDRVAYLICRSQDSEEAIHKRFIKRGNYSIKNLPEYVDPWSYHTTCELHHDNLDLRLLRVCKLIYGEAKLIPYQTNTFSFKSPVALTRFYLNFPIEHRDKVRRLHLHMELATTDIYLDHRHPRQHAFLLRLIPYFRNITHINISVVLGSTACWSAKLPKNHQGQQPRWMQAVLSLKALPLKTATVMIYDDVQRCVDHDSESEDPEIHAEGAGWSNRRRRTVRQDMAEWIEREVLAGGPVGRETTK